MTTNLKLCPNGCSSDCGLIRWMEKKFSRGFFSAYFCGMSGSILDHFGKKFESGLAVFLERVGKSAVTNFKQFPSPTIKSTPSSFANDG